MSNGTTATTTALARQDATPRSMTTGTDPRTAIAPRGPEDVWRMAQAVAKAQLYGVRSTEEAMIRMATGMELGLSPMQSIRGVYVIDAKGVQRPTLSADMMVGVCKRSDLCAFFRLVESTDKRAVYETHRRGDPEPVRLAYTIEQAQRAGLAGRGTWAAHPEAMLRARAASGLARIVYPDLLNGLYDEREFDEPEPARSSPAPIASVVADVVREREVVTDGDAFAVRIAEAIDETALSRVAGDIKRARGLDDADRSRLRDAFAARQRDLRGAHADPEPAPEPSAAPTREPGED